jgi:hypothetical protein
MKRNEKSRQEDKEMAKVIAIANQKGGCGYGKLEIMQSSQP